MRYTKEQLRAAYEKLPHEVRRAMGTEEQAHEYARLMEEFGLTVDEARRVSEEAAPVIYGLVHPNEFSKNLRGKLLNLPQEKFDSLVRRIDTELFAPIRSMVLQKMREAHEMHMPSTIHPKNTDKPVADNTAPNASTTLQAPVKDFSQQKMEQTFHAPAETTKIVEPPSPTAPDNKQSLKQKYSGGTDPYREPIK